MTGKPQPLVKVIKFVNDGPSDCEWRIAVLECGHRRREHRTFVPRDYIGGKHNYRHCSACGAKERKERSR